MLGSLPDTIPLKNCEDFQMRSVYLCGSRGCKKTKDQSWRAEKKMKKLGQIQRYRKKRGSNSNFLDFKQSLDPHRCTVSQFEKPTNH